MRKCSSSWRHNISESLIYNWRSARKAAVVVMGAPEKVEFIPAGIIEAPVSLAMAAVVPAAPEREPEPASPSASVTDKTGAIEITVTVASPTP